MSSQYRGLHRINVNENDDLTNFDYHQTSPNSRIISELHAKVKSYKAELEKKDELINELSSMSPRFSQLYPASAHNVGASVKWEDSLKTSPTLRSESAAELSMLRMKNENLTTELMECESKLHLKDKYLKELKSKIEVMNENAQRQSITIQTLQERVQAAESQSGMFEHATTRGSATIERLQKDNREAQERILELESRLRNHAVVNEETHQTADASKRKLKEIVLQMANALNAPFDENAVDDPTALIEMVKELSQDKILQDSKIATLEDTLNAHNLETKASRETIMRLVSEVGKEQKNASETNYMLEKFKKDSEDFLTKQECMERENDLLKQRIAALEKTIDSSREELIQTRNKAAMMSDDTKRLNHDLSLSVSEFEVFKETMAKLLSSHHFEIDSTEESIKNRIKELAANEREYKMKTDSLNGTVAELSKQLEQQCEIYHDTIRRAKSAETSTVHHENKLRDLENELISGNILHDTLRNEKNKYMQFLQQMSEAMGMTSLCLDVGYDMNTDSLIARARQLAKLESDALVQKTSTNHSLHKKLKLLKEQLQSKELHIELLRKKIAQQDEKEQTRSALAIDRDDAIVTVQKLQKKVERLQHALGDERVKVTQLKAQLADTNQLKIVTMDQRRKIDDLSTFVDKLSTTKDRQRQKLSCLKKELKMTENDAGEHSSSLKMQLNALTNDLKSNKSLLDEVNRREKQLVDFREVVARMLGLDVTSLAIPDYEIISRLEKLIRNHHIGAAAGASLDRSLEHMNQPFVTGYENEINPVYHPQPPLTRSRTASPRKHRHHRSRSISPVRY